MTAQALSSLLSNWIFLLMVAGIPAYGYFKKVEVYDAFTEGAKDGFNVTLKIIPHMVAMIVAIGMFRASGAIDVLSKWLAPVLSKIGMSPELLPLALMRPLSGAASTGLTAELITTHGPDSLIAKTAATMMGSTETTFYVVAIYFGAVAVKRTRHAIPAGLIADAVGILVSVWICRIVFL